MCPRMLMLFAALGASIPLPAQTQVPQAQTARQALIEMFLGNEADAFAKHLPDAARKLLVHDENRLYSSTVFRMATFGRQMTLRGERTEILDSGSTILTSPQGQSDRLEVAVERDSMAGENDEIELSVHLYHDGREKSFSVIPRLIFTLKPEKGIWRLLEVTASERVPLTDPDYLSGLRQQQPEANESAAQGRIGIITAAETGYADQHPDRGYTRTLPSLFAQELNDNTSDDNSEVSQLYYDPGQGSSEWNGYRFALTGCEGSPGRSSRSQLYPSTQTPVRRRFAPNLER